MIPRTDRRDAFQRRSLPRTRVLVVFEPRYACQAQPSGLIAGLRDLPVSVRPCAVSRQWISRAEDDLAWADVVVARGRSAEVLQVLDLAAARGLPVVDRADAVRKVRDKAAMAVALAAAGLPMPITYYAPTHELSDTVPSRNFPLVLKPVFGDNARGLRLVRSAGELSRLRWSESPALAQTWVPGDGMDVKVYGVGRHLFAVRKPSPLRPSAAPAQPTRLTDDMAGLADRCGRQFGLTVFGVDLLRGPHGPVVIEVNDFPNFTSVPGADRALAAHVVAAAEQTRQVSVS